MKKRIIFVSLLILFIFAALMYLAAVTHAQVTWTLTVVSAHGNPSPAVGDHLYNDGDPVTCSVSSPVVDGGVSYTCTGWTGTGDVPAIGSGTSVTTFAISQDSSITWLWQVTQWTLTVASAHDNPIPDVGVHTYNDGDSVTCSVSSPVVEVGVSYTCTGWSGSGSVPSSGSGTSVNFAIHQDSSITWLWQVTQWTLTVVSAHDSPSPGIGDHLYNDGSSVTCTVTSPVTEGSTVWTCTGWVGTGSVPSTGSDTSTGLFTITQNSTITWNWQGTPVQRKLTVVSAHDSPSPSVGDHLYNDGSSVACSVSSPVTEGGVSYTCTGWSGSGSVPSGGSGISVGFTITQNSSITWLWQVTQWTLTVVSAHDSPSPAVGGHLYNDGTSVACSVSSPVIEAGVSYTCTGWVGSGSVPSSGSGVSVMFSITQNSSITWNWIVTPSVHWSLTVSSVHGSPSPGVGVHTYSDGSSVTCSVSSPVVDGGVSYSCAGWTGTGSVPISGSGTSTTFSITQNSSITWNWVVTSSVQWSLTVTSSHDSPDPGVGDNLYNNGSAVTCSVTSPVTEAGQVWTCAGWVGTGSVPSSGSGVSVMFSITENSSITWSWVAGPLVEWRLTVVSAHGDPSPGVGDHLYSDGNSITCNVSSPVVEAGVSYTYVGWVGTGSVPSSGSGVSVMFSITEDSSITWRWQAQGGPTIESCDSAGVQRDVFSLDETVHVIGSGFGANQTYNVYIVYDTAWFDGTNITGRVQAATVSSDAFGNISLTAVWNKPLALGVYDILVDVNGNGRYDAGVDALYSNKIVAAAATFSMPEYLFGTILGLAGCFAALGAFRIYKRKRR